MSIDTTGAPLPSPVAIDGDVVVRRGGWVRAVWRSRNGRVGLIIVILVVLGGICGLAGWTPYGADIQNPQTVLKGVSWSHLMGTDQFGRDVFSGALQGLGVSLEIAFLSVAIAGVIGSLGGIAAGFLGKWTSATIMRATDMMFAIPTVLFALAIVTALGPSVLDSAIAIGVGWIPIYVRVVRSPVLALRESDFVRAGRVLGYSTITVALSPHSAERDGRHRRPDQPRPRLGDTRRGELEFSRSRPTPAHTVLG